MGGFAASIGYRYGGNRAYDDEHGGFWPEEFHSSCHWDTAEIGQTVQILFRKNHPNDTRLVGSGILESPYIGLESWGFWALVIGIIMTWFGWRKLAGPLFDRLRQFDRR